MIMILVHLCKMMISASGFFIFRDVRGGGGGRGLKGQKMAQDDKKNLPVAVDIPGTIYHMIVIYGTLVENVDACRV